MSARWRALPTSFWLDVSVVLRHVADDGMQEEEQEAEEIVLEESDEEDDKPALYNPKDVPLDFDGKPIPYWLFKLHGLNIRFEFRVLT